ncbi:hypothetical protein K440DRAFT_364789 [Wilcoxina mikolae CBS 423.85]|nr:hypothetical protein K440DRAFT_364789 [Wilcoxina mikolae CBS 423.85]
MNGGGELCGMFRVLQQAGGGRCSVNRGWPYFFSDPCVFLLLIGGSFYMLLFVFCVSCRVLPIVLRNQCYIMSLWILEAANLALGSWGRGEWDHVISTRGCAGEIGIHAGGTADLILFLYFFEVFASAPPINSPTLQRPGFDHCTRGCNDRLATQRGSSDLNTTIATTWRLQPRLLIAAIPSDSMRLDIVTPQQLVLRSD